MSLPDNFPVMGYGEAKPVTDEDIARDEVGFTNPNFHQRVDITQLPDESKPKDYTLRLQSTNYFRIVESFPLSDQDESLEIP